MNALGYLRDAGAVMSGHFVLSSGRHSDTYAEKFRALEQPEVAVALGAELAGKFDDIDVVVAPAVGGVVLGFVTALALGARSIFTERVEGRMVLRRGFEIRPGERVLVVEDVITTGKSLKEVLEVVPKDQLAGIGCLLDRSGGSGLEVQALATLDAESWDPSECPLCADGVPADSPGSRHVAAR